jgi:hypothetical protein
MIVNLTPHEVRIIRDGRDDVVFPPSGDVARLGTIELGTQYGLEVPYELVEFHHLENPPPRKDDVRYIVSLPTALASPRGDFLVPYREVRDDNGRIIGCRMLAQPV